ncbi:hypothetical protein B0F90DRAFT_137745 [Multifurca ochricompacta]|uniref:Uncharacterized protein n=1 Tax=Multifurca ochricompacta TaxID=376703 RepID=A0AAD4QUH5_9AGAM|nr:hypothetical protein B0F90DRAFT_137745 [Multifurca ochricompacta]
MNPAAIGAVLVGGPGTPTGPSKQEKTSTLVSPSLNLTLPWCLPPINVTNSASPGSGLPDLPDSLPNETGPCVPLPVTCRPPLDGTSHPATSAPSLNPTRSSSKSTTTIKPKPPSSPVQCSTSTPVWLPSLTSSPVGSGVLASPISPSPVRPVLPSKARTTASIRLPPITTTPPTRGLASTPSSGSPGINQSTHTTITSTITETPGSTFATPVSITETTDGRVTITAPPFITTAGLSTLPDGSVVSVTHVIANPLDVSTGHSLFRNHPAVIAVFLASGIAIASMAALAFYCCRRQRRRSQHRESRFPPEISLPQPQSPFADSAAVDTMREHAIPNIRWNRSMLSRDHTDQTQNLISVPLNRSEDSLPASRGVVDLPLPSFHAQRSTSRSSHRIPVPYTGVGAHGNNSRVADRQVPGPSSEYRQVQVVQDTPSLTAPPRLPTRSPLRLLSARYGPRPQENSRASSPSVYPPSLHLLEAEADSPYMKEIVASVPPPPPKGEPVGWLARRLSSGSISGKEQNRVQASGNSPGTLISPVDSDGSHSFALSASSASHALYSPLESPTSETGTALTSLLDDKIYRTLPLPRVPSAALFAHSGEQGKSDALARLSRSGAIGSN